MADIFKSYDIRGVYPSELNEDIVYKLGKAYVTFLKAKKIIVGRDMRTSSPQLLDALVRGVTEMGCDVVDIGMCSTPLFYFAVGTYKTHGGIMVTASHNPGKYNGLKIVREHVIPIGSDSGLLELKKLADQELDVAEVPGKITPLKILPAYFKHVFSFVDKEKIRNKKIIVDCGNGMAGVTEVLVLEQLDCELVILEREPDGNFPNHEPNPVKEENIADLKKAIKKHKADIGIAFDGDCDRVVFVDEKGQTCDGSLTAALITPSLLKKNPRAKIIYTPIQSRILPETISRYGGIPVLHRVGHAFIKRTMREDKIIFASEKSGHFYWKDNFNADSSVITALKVLEILCDDGRALSELLEPLRTYATSEEINFDVDDKDGKIKEFEMLYATRAQRTNHVDGVTFDFGDWWFNVRKSGTEPLLRLNIEATHKEMLLKKIAELRAVMLR